MKDIIDINRVKSVVQTTFDIYEREKTGLFSSRKYLEEVKLHTEKKIFENGKILKSDWIDYRVSPNETENTVRRKVSEYSNGMVVFSRTYNSRGKLIRSGSVSRENSNKCEYKTAYGRVEIETYEDKSKWEQQYDFSDRLMKEISYDKFGNVKNTYEYFYDGHSDRRIRNVSYDKYGKVTETGRWLYDKNNMKYKEIYDGCEGHYEEEFRYNEYGDLVWMRWHPYRGYSWYSIQQKHEEWITTYEYRYDDKGNWIEMRQFRNGASNMTVTREIEYLY